MTKLILYGIALMLVLVGCSKPEQCQENNRDNRMCTMEINPVCGCNNKTYNNACEAEARGITTFTIGECK